MAISPVDASAGQPDPSPVVSRAAPIKDPIVSSGTVAAPVHAAAPSDKEVSKAVDTLNATLGNAGVSFSKDQKSGLTVVTVTDTQTDEVIRQIPSKEALALTHSIDETLDTLRGNLIDHKA